MNRKLLTFLESIYGNGSKASGSNYQFYSPFIEHRKKKLAINVTPNKKGEYHWHCWISNKGGTTIESLLKQTGNANRISECSKITGRVLRNIPSETKDEILQLPEGAELIWKNTTSLIRKRALNYLTERGITPEDMLKYQIRYCESGDYARRIIIPSYDEFGKLNYFISRKMYDGVEFAYKNPKVSKNVVGFELLINWKLPIVLVEGVFDAIAVKRNAIPLFGKTIPDALKLKIIQEGVDEVYICLDEDAKRDSIVAAEYFMANGIDVYMVDTSEGDPSELGFKRITELISQSDLLTFSDIVEYTIGL